MNILGIKAQLDTYDIDSVAEQYRSRLSHAQITSDIGPAQVKSIEQTLDTIFSPLRLDYSRFRSYRDAVVRLISITEKTNVTGTSEMTRKASGAQACIEYRFRDQTLNLYEVLNMLEYVCNILDGILDIIRERQDRVIAILSILKIERGFVQ